MKLVNSNGGHSIGVYNPATQKKEKVYKIDIALSNSQVNHILTDDDVARFYKSIIEGAHNKKAEELREVLKE